LRKVGDVIVFDLAQREGDWLKLGVDLQEHICNIFGLGEAERRRFYRRQRRRHKDKRGAALLHRQMLLMDHLAWLLWWKGKEIRILLDAEGWQSIADLAKKFATLNREMNR
jgi:RNA:NAD 2'-phosphotransferase (TPT1/KptA family)